jgi:thiol-disulfide isomerase/thioredoxin
MKTIKFLTIIFLLVTGTFKSLGQTKGTTVTGEFSHLRDNDTVRLLVYKYGEFPYNIEELHQSYIGIVENRRFKIDVPLKDTRSYGCRLIIPRMRIKGSILLIKKGDQLFISGNDLSINDLTGKGAEKTNIIRKLNDIWDSFSMKARVAARGQTVAFGLALTIQYSEKAVQQCKDYVTLHGTHLSAGDRNLLQAYAQNPIWDIYNTLYYGNYSAMQQDSVGQVLKDVWLPFRNSCYKMPQAKAGNYDFYFAQNLIEDYCLKQVISERSFNSLRDNENLRGKYDYFKKHYAGMLREKILSLLMLSAPESNDVAYCYNDAIKFITDNEFRLALDNHCQCIPGHPAYNFTLSDTNKAPHHLTDYKGKILVLDFWFTGCGNCRELTPKLRMVEERFKNNNRVLFISISSDKNLSVWKNSIKSGLYTTSSNEINLYTAGNGTNDPLYKKTNTYSSPTLKLIDDKGNWCENPVDCRFDDGKDLIGKIEKALKN